MEELHTDSIDGDYEASYGLGHVPGRGRTPTVGNWGTRREYYLWHKEYWATQFIEGPLTEEYGLDNIETEKPLLETDDFVEFVRYY